MKQAYPGFSDAQYKPYHFDPQVFIVDKQSAMQGYVTSEPLAVKKAAGFEPKVFLLADAGLDTPSTLIETTQDYIDNHADIVQRFVDASIVGWYTYIYGDPSAGNAADQEGQPDDDRRRNRLRHREDEGIRHGRFRRVAGKRHRLLRRRQMKSF